MSRRVNESRGESGFARSRYRKGDVYRDPYRRNWWYVFEERADSRRVSSLTAWLLNLRWWR